MIHTRNALASPRCCKVVGSHSHLTFSSAYIRFNGEDEEHSVGKIPTRGKLYIQLPRWAKPRHLPYIITDGG